MNNDLIDLRADGPLLILSFETGGDTSKLTRKFIAELSTLVMQSPKKPLVLTSAHGLAAVYRAVPSWAYSLRDTLGRELFNDILRRFADIDSNYSGALNFALSDELSVAVLDGAWAADRTPENTPRHALPVFNDEATSRALAGLVDRWSTERHIVTIQRAAATGYEPYSSRPNLTPSKDLDPMVRLATKVQAAARRVVGLE